MPKPEQEQEQERRERVSAPRTPFCAPSNTQRGAWLWSQTARWGPERSGGSGGERAAP